MNKENIDITSVVLTTDRLILRATKKEDLYDMYEYAKVEGVGEMAGWPHHKSIEETAKIIDMFIEEKNQFSVIYEGKMIGSLGIEKYNEEEFPSYMDKVGREVGITLSRDYQGLGLGTEAIKRVVKYLFEEEKLDFVVAGYFAYNEKSKHMQEKAGFKRHHTTTVNRLGREIEEVYNVIEKRE